MDDNLYVDKGYNSCQDEWNFEEKGIIANE
jgi:hypothetical protein